MATHSQWQCSDAWYSTKTSPFGIAPIRNASQFGQASNLECLPIRNGCQFGVASIGMAPLLLRFAALRAAAAAVGQAQESCSQAVNDSRISCSAAGAGHARSGGRIFESPVGPAPRSWSRRPTRARRSTRQLRSTREQRQVHKRPSARVGAVCEHGYAQSVYRRDV